VRPLHSAVDLHVICSYLPLQFYILFSVTYATLLRSLVTSPCAPENSASFGCQLAQTLWTWVLYAVVLTACGLVVILPLSIGCNPIRRTPVRALFTMGLTAIYAAAPYFSVEYWETTITEPYSGPEQQTLSPYWDLGKASTLAVAFVLLAAFLYFFVLSLFPGKLYDYPRVLQKILVTSNTNGEFRLKKAATRKINLMLMNAKSLQVAESRKQEASLSCSRLSSVRSSNRTDADKTMLNFVLHGLEGPNWEGGFLWTWKLLLNQDFFEVEG